MLRLGAIERLSVETVARGGIYQIFPLNLQRVGRQYIGAFAKFGNAVVKFRCIYLFASNLSSPTGRIFMKFDIVNFN